jgi:hypothetical protein
VNFGFINFILLFMILTGRPRSRAGREARSLSRGPDPGRGLAAPVRGLAERPGSRSRAGREARIPVEGWPRGPDPGRGLAERPGSRSRASREARIPVEGWHNFFVQLTTAVHRRKFGGVHTLSKTLGNKQNRIVRPN